MRKRTWFRIRMAAIGTTLALGSLVFINAKEVPVNGMAGPVDLFLIFASVAGLLVFPFMVAALIRFLASLPTTDEAWTRPTHSDNPLAYGNPLLFFHFAAFVIMAWGAGAVLTAFWGGLTQLVQGVVVATGGMACLGGVYLAMRWCPEKMGG